MSRERRVVAIARVEVVARSLGYALHEAATQPLVGYGSLVQRYLHNAYRVAGHDVAQTNNYLTHALVRGETVPYRLRVPRFPLCGAWLAELVRGRSRSCLAARRGTLARC